MMTEHNKKKPRRGAFKRSKGRVYTISIPIMLDINMVRKMERIGFTSVSELCRDLIRTWVNYGDEG